MIKLIFCAKRHPNMSRSEFQDYWLNHHGPMFKKFADTYKAVRYVQSHTLDTPLNEGMQKSRGTVAAYDGVGEIWWQSEEDFLAAINSPEGQKLRPIFIEDEAKFVDMEKSSVFFTTEHVLVDEIKQQQPQNKSDSPSLKKKIIKVSVMYPKTENSSFDAEYYLTKHIPMVKEALGTALKGIAFEKGISGRESNSSPSFVAIGHMYFDSVEEYQNAMGYHADKMKSDIPKFTNVMPIIQMSEVALSSIPEI